MAALEGGQLDQLPAGAAVGGTEDRYPAAPGGGAEARGDPAELPGHHVGGPRGLADRDRAHPRPGPPAVSGPVGDRPGPAPESAPGHPRIACTVEGGAQPSHTQSRRPRGPPGSAAVHRPDHSQRVAVVIVRNRPPDPLGHHPRGLQGHPGALRSGGRRGRGLVRGGPVPSCRQPGVGATTPWQQGGQDQQPGFEPGRAAMLSGLRHLAYSDCPRTRLVASTRSLHAIGHVRPRLTIWGCSSPSCAAVRREPIKDGPAWSDLNGRDPEVLMRHTYSAEVQQRPLTATSDHDRQHTNLVRHSYDSAPGALRRRLGYDRRGGR